MDKTEGSKDDISLSQVMDELISYTRNQLAAFMLMSIILLFIIELDNITNYSVALLIALLLGVYSVYTQRRFGYYFSVLYWFYLFNALAALLRLPVIAAIIPAVLLAESLSKPAKENTKIWTQKDTILLAVFAVFSLSFLIQPQIDQFLYDILPSQQKTDNQLLERTITQQNPLLCQQIQTQNIKDQCYEKLSRLLNDVDLCKKIEYTAKRDNCVSEWSRLNNNNSFCHLIEWGGQRKTCEERGS